MDSPTLRPTFRLPLALSREAAIEHIRARLNEVAPARWVGKGRWAEIHVRGEDRRLWSPHLSIRLDHREDGGEGSELFARFAPRPEIWTGLVFLYAALAFVTLLGGIFGWVQLASNESPWGFWALAIGIPGILGIHLVGWVGRRLSGDQMRELQELLRPAVEEIRGDPAREPQPSSGVE